MQTAHPPLEIFDRLLDYLPLVYDAGAEPLWGLHFGPIQDDGILRFPWTVYGPVIEAFFMEAARPVWADYAYDGTRARERLEDPEAVLHADLAQVREMLTFCILWERFSDGFWASIVEEGKIRRLLERLAALREEIYSKPPQAGS